MQRLRAERQEAADSALIFGCRAGGPVGQPQREQLRVTVGLGRDDIHRDGCGVCRSVECGQHNVLGKPASSPNSRKTASDIRV